MHTLLHICTSLKLYTLPKQQYLMIALEIEKQKTKLDIRK